MNLNCCQTRPPPGGVSLVEVLIATSIGLFLVAGSLSLYANIRRIESQANMQLHIQESATF
ncbi:MAG: Tfp pilus assembly protein PilW, partial [Gammaproteobacteria bacterium]